MTAEDLGRRGQYSCMPDARQVLSRGVENLRNHSTVLRVKHPMNTTNPRSRLSFAFNAHSSKTIALTLKLEAKRDSVSRTIVTTLVSQTSTELHSSEAPFVIHPFQLQVLNLIVMMSVIVNHVSLDLKPLQPTGRSLNGNKCPIFFRQPG